MQFLALVYCGSERLTNLDETDVGGLLTEALTADVHLKSRISHWFQFILEQHFVRWYQEGFHIRRTCGSDQRGERRRGCIDRA